MNVGYEHVQTQTQQFMKDMRFDMPGLHREFLKYLETNTSVRSCIQQWCYADDVHEVADSVDAMDIPIDIHNNNTFSSSSAYHLDDSTTLGQISHHGT